MPDTPQQPSPGLIEAALTPEQLLTRVRTRVRTRVWLFLGEEVATLAGLATVNELREFAWGRRELDADRVAALARRIQKGETDY